MKRLEKFIQMVLSQDTHIKITFGAIIGLIGVIIGAMIYLTDIKQDVSSNKQTIVVIYEDIEDIMGNVDDNEDSIQLQEVKQAEINTKLASIENRQIEMIQILKELK